MAWKLAEIGPALVGRAADGDSQAVAEIVRALQKPIYGIALRMLLSPHDAEDATQEALVRVVTRLAQYRGESAFSTWAYRIAVRRILDHRRHRGPSLTFEAFAEDLKEGRDDDAVERTENAILYHQLKMVCGRAMLQCLDEDQRIAFVLGEILELSSSDAAEILEIEPATFRKRVSRARSALTEFLGRRCGVFNESAACACHRRLDRAVALGRVRPDDLEVTSGNLVQLRRQLACISEMQRVTAFYKDEPNLESKSDFVVSIRSLLSAGREES